MPQSGTHRVLSALVAGRDPRSLQLLPARSILHTPDVLRALLLALNALEAATARARRRSALPPNVGRKWTAAEDAELRGEMAAGHSVEAIAARHGRSMRAIALRLPKIALAAAGSDADASTDALRMHCPRGAQGEISR